MENIHVAMYMEYIWKLLSEAVHDVRNYADSGECYPLRGRPCFQVNIPLINLISKKIYH